MTTDERTDDPTLYWCKRTDGVIVEHETTDHEGHRGHVRCVPVGAIAAMREVLP